MKPPELTAGRAWAALAAGVVIYELAAPDGELMSEGVDRGMERGSLARTAIYAAIGCTALHLVNAIPENIDPFHRLLKLRGIDKSDSV